MNNKATRHGSGRILLAITVKALSRRKHHLEDLPSKFIFYRFAAIDIDGINGILAYQ
jgi:hypothetical protein